MGHQHDEIFAALRAEQNFEFDDSMARYIAGEPHWRTGNGADSANGRAFAAEIAKTHGVEGVLALHRVLWTGSSTDEGDNVMDEAIAEQVGNIIKQLNDKDKRRSFILGATLFCEYSGVIRYHGRAPDWWTSCASWE